MQNVSCSAINCTLQGEYRRLNSDFHWILISLCFAVIKQADLTSAGLLEVVGNAEREKAATPAEAPLSEWEVTRIKPDYGSHLTTQVLLANSDEAKAALQVDKSPSKA